MSEAKEKAMKRIPISEQQMTETKEKEKKYIEELYAKSTEIYRLILLISENVKKPGIEKKDAEELKKCLCVYGGIRESDRKLDSCTDRWETVTKCYSKGEIVCYAGHMEKELGSVEKVYDSTLSKLNQAVANLSIGKEGTAA